MNPTARDYYFLIWGICFSWFMSYLNETASVVVIVLALIYFFRYMNKLVLFAILVCPIWLIPTWNIGLGVKDYLTGNAKWQFYGYPNPNTVVNINREFRVENDPQGCLVSDIGLMKSSLYNKTIKTLIRNFGYQKGSYTGAIPSKAEAIALLLEPNAISCEVEIFRKEELVFWKDSVLLSLNLKEQGVNFARFSNNYQKDNSAKIYFSENFAVAKFNNQWVYLIDTYHKKIITYYNLNIK